MRSATTWRLARAACLATSFGAYAARAADDEYSSYERDTIARALVETSGAIDAAPEGKLVESIEVVTLDVIEDRDPAPDFLNWFHATSRPAVIEREVLLKVGQAWRNALADETARNLRDLRQLSVVLVLPLTGSTPERVRVLVVTKDVWSLRLNTNFRIAGGQLEFLYMQPSEVNLLGSHTTLAAQMLLELDATSFGGRVIVPRVAGAHVLALLDANLIFNRETGDPEGSFGAFEFGQPLWSNQTEWGWGTGVAWRREVTRIFEGGQLRSFDATVTPADDAIPYVYSGDTLFWQTSVVRSFGARAKWDVEAGLEAIRRAFVVPQLGAFDPAAAREFVDTELPVSDTRIGPFAQLRTRSTDYARLLEFETLGLQEDAALGHNVWLKLYPASRHAGSSRDMLGTFASASWTSPLGDGIARAWAASTYEAAVSDRVDAQFEAGVRAVTPRLGFGRLVYDAGVLHRWRDYLNRKFTLGGEGRLRGWVTQAVVGRDVVASNLEFRTRAIEILTAQLGLALFYDTGDAFDGFERMRLKHGAGIGLRALIPQLDRYVFRADLGFPLEQGRGARTDLVITFGQAFPLPQPDPLIPVLAPRPK